MPSGSDTGCSRIPGPARGYFGQARGTVCCLLRIPHLEHPAATIGLGDTFLAGTLLILGQPEGVLQPPGLANGIKEI